MILGVHHTAIATHDIEALARFYIDNFHLEKIVDDEWFNTPDLEAIVGLPNSSARFMLLYAGNNVSSSSSFETRFPRRAAMIGGCRNPALRTSVSPSAISKRNMNG